MDVAIVGKGLKLKVKKTNLAVDPSSAVTKFDADAIINLGSQIDSSRINNFRVILERPGEYEVSGLKISGIKNEKGMVFVLNSESTNILLSNASSLEKMSSEKLGECQVVIINVDDELNASLITAIEPRVAILYGEKANDAAKSLGKESSAKSQKITFSEDKLPEELELTVLS